MADTEISFENKSGEEINIKKRESLSRLVKLVNTVLTCRMAFFMQLAWNTRKWMCFMNISMQLFIRDSLTTTSTEKHFFEILLEMFLLYYMDSDINRLKYALTHRCLGA